MSLRVSGKHMDIGDAFRIRIEERIGEMVSKYFDGGYTGHVTVEKQGSRFIADCLVRLDTGTVLQAAGEAQDPLLAFDAAGERVDKRLRRYKRRLKSHQAPGSNGVFDDVSYTVMAPVPDDDEDIPEDYAPTIVAETSMALRSMSVASAVVELDLKDSPVVVFRNAGSTQVNIVYRRADGNIGWIDPSTVAGENVTPT
jgi:ribosomal subunit interface protein